MQPNQYVNDSQKLLVDLLRLFDLQEKAVSSLENDIFCKCTLMPSKMSHHSKLVRFSANPIFEESFEFEYLDPADLADCYLEISLFELPLYATKDEIRECLGTAVIKLNYSNIEIKKMFVKELKPFAKPNEVIIIRTLTFEIH